MRSSAHDQGNAPLAATLELGPSIADKQAYFIRQKPFSNGDHESPERLAIDCRYVSTVLRKGVAVHLGVAIMRSQNLERFLCYEITQYASPDTVGFYCHSKCWLSCFERSNVNAINSYGAAFYTTSALA